MKKIAVICLVLLMCACSKRDNQMSPANNLNEVRAKLDFTCVHEADHLPVLDPEANALFTYGRYLEKLDGPKDFNAIARYYRIAAAYGHYKANHNLQLLVSEGMASSPNPEHETIDLAEQLISAGVPGGYYDMGHYLELGYGVKQDADKARRYFRKAADLGSPQAQAYVGNLLAPRDRAPDVARQMRRCAAEQGYGTAATTLGIDFQTDKLFTEAVGMFQKGVESGDSISALALEEGFTGPSSTNRMRYLGLQPDPERSHRYQLIGKFLDDSTQLSITEVQDKYRRTPDVHDATYDTEIGAKAEVQHFCLYPSDATPERMSGSVRIHGYFRADYFVVTRLDWFHEYHA